MKRSSNRAATAAADSLGEPGLDLDRKGTVEGRPREAGRIHAEAAGAGYPSLDATTPTIAVASERSDRIRTSIQRTGALHKFAELPEQDGATEDHRRGRQGSSKLPLRPGPSASTLMCRPCLTVTYYRATVDHWRHHGEAGGAAACPESLLPGPAIFSCHAGGHHAQVHWAAMEDSRTRIVHLHDGRDRDHADNHGTRIVLLDRGGGPWTSFEPCSWPPGPELRRVGTSFGVPGVAVAAVDMIRRRVAGSMCVAAGRARPTRRSSAATASAISTWTAIRRCRCATWRCWSTRCGRGAGRAAPISSTGSSICELAPRSPTSTAVASRSHRRGPDVPGLRQLRAVLPGHRGSVGVAGGRRRRLGVHPRAGLRRRAGGRAGSLAAAAGSARLAGRDRVDRPAPQRRAAGPDPRRAARRAIGRELGLGRAIGRPAGCRPGPRGLAQGTHVTASPAAALRPLAESATATASAGGTGSARRDGHHVDPFAARPDPGQRRAGRRRRATARRAPPLGGRRRPDRRPRRASPGARASCSAATSAATRTVPTSSTETASPGSTSSSFASRTWSTPSTPRAPTAPTWRAATRSAPSA